ncbi:hypothetical protein [Flavobacterium sp.]|uniref:hypothetical protein n=1 Tax=Flavobacterium sp. TaxID=239 RepID=UPI003751A504
MKNILFLVLISFSFYSCNQTIKQSDIVKLNGYWEIEKVIKQDGDKKEYKINEAIDYIEIKNNKGFRKKVYPQYDGKYLVNDIIEVITITDSSGIFYINYKTDYAKWKEQIVFIQDSSFTVKNQDKIEYNYKKQIPFSLK